MRSSRAHRPKRPHQPHNYVGSAKPSKQNAQGRRESDGPVRATRTEVPAGKKHTPATRYANDRGENRKRAPWYAE
jgi:hypothetical protein